MRPEKSCKLNWLRLTLGMARRALTPEGSRMSKRGSSDLLCCAHCPGVAWNGAGLFRQKFAERNDALLEPGVVICSYVPARATQVTLGRASMKTTLGFSGADMLAIRKEQVLQQTSKAEANGGQDSGQILIAPS
jgi:hypothetical protein